MMNKLLVISAVWCPSCLILKKQLKKLNEEYPELVIKMLDYDFDDISEYNVGKILPVLIIESNGIEVDRLVGEKEYDEIISFLRENELI